LSASNHSAFPLEKNCETLLDNEGLQVSIGKNFETLLDNEGLQVSIGKNFGNSCTRDLSAGGVGQISVKEGKLLVGRLPGMWCINEYSFYTTEWAVDGAGQVSLPAPQAGLPVSSEATGRRSLEN
jgi:hypothetical protein